MVTYLWYFQVRCHAFRNDGFQTHTADRGSNGGIHQVVGADGKMKTIQSRPGHLQFSRFVVEIPPEDRIVWSQDLN